MPRRSNVVMEELRQEAVRLRTEERLSLSEIVSRVGISKGTAIRWLRDYPLTPEEMRLYRERRARSDLGLRKKPREVDGKWWEIVKRQELSNADRGRIAETAVLFRLAVHGFDVYNSFFDGARADCVVLEPGSGRLFKVQVKCTAGHSRYGLPWLSLQRSYGAAKTKMRYTEAEFDFIVGYDLRTDIAYVYSHEETLGRGRSISVTPEAAEAWHKLKGTSPSKRA